MEGESEMNETRTTMLGVSGWLTRRISEHTLEGDSFVWAFGGFPVRCDTCGGVSLSEQW
jgi:hypothetical protein